MRNFYYILKNLGVKFNFVYTRDLFLAQERNQTLWGMKKLLEHYGIKVTAVKSATRSLDDVTYPFVCQLSQEGLVAITHEPKDLEEFIEQWNGYALLCDVSHAKEPHYYRHKLKEKIEYALPWITLAGVVLTALCFLFDGFSLSTLLLTCFNLLGLYFSFRSAVNECAGSCSVVTESAAGKLFGYSLSVIGMAYFGISLLPVLFVPSWMPVWSWIAVLALVMPVWSISHQAFVLHAWCKNCLVVQAAVVLSGLVVWCNGLSAEGVFSIQPLVALPSLYLLTIYLLDIVFEHYKVVKHPPMDGTVLRLMYNPVLRQEILHSGRKVDVSNVPDVWMMNPEGKEELFLAISLQCVHCKEQFFKLYKAMEKGELKNYRIKIVISPSAQEAKVIEALAATAIHESREKAMALLAAWYETQNPKLFLHSVKRNLPMEGVKESLEAIKDTVDSVGIEGLPFVTLDGYEITPTIFWAKVELEN